MTDTEIVKVEVEQIAAGLAKFQEVASSIVVKDAESCLTAKMAMRDVRNYMKDVKLKLGPFVESAKRAYDTAKEQRDKYLNPAQAIDDALGQKVKDFERREREAAEAEARRLNEERRIAAEKQAAEERKERERVAAEQRKQEQAAIEEQRKAGEIGKREAERLKKEAAEAEARERERAKADAILQAANVQTVEVAPSIPKVAGVPSRQTWRFRIVDESRIPRSYMKPNEVSIGSFVREGKKAGEVIPGVEAYLD